MNLQDHVNKVPTKSASEKMDEFVNSLKHVKTWYGVFKSGEKVFNYKYIDSFKTFYLADGGVFQDLKVLCGVNKDFWRDSNVDAVINEMTAYEKQLESEKKCI